MSQAGIEFSVFTKPWKNPLPELARRLGALGFRGIELPVRPGFQVEPEGVARGLPEAAGVLADCGLRIASVAASPSEPVMAACAEAGVPVIRVCLDVPSGETYLEAESRLRREHDALAPLLEKHRVTLGIQNHCGRFVSSAAGVRRLIGDRDPRRFGAVWDFAHGALSGEQLDLALDIVGSHLCMVNLKNAFYRRKSGPEALPVEWGPYWTTGRHGLASWPRAAAELKRRGYAGVVCLTAEYSDPASLDRLIAEDLAYAQSLFSY